jgi:hypothetical protein
VPKPSSGRAIEVEMDQGAFVSRAEAGSTTLRELLERYLEGITPLKKGAEPKTNRLRLMMRHPLARRFVAGVALRTGRGGDEARCLVGMGQDRKQQQRQATQHQLMFFGWARR